MRDPLDEARTTVGRLITLTRAGEAEAVVGSLGILTLAGETHRDRLRHILSTLIDATASMVLARTDELGSNEMFEADLRRDDDSIVDIDAVDPPVRATIRALLAAVNRNPEDMADQVELVLAGGALAWRDCVILALQWTISALDWCERHRVATPPWLPRQRAA